MSGGRTVWVLTDGVPGHEAQSKGLIRVLGQLGKWDVHWVPVSLRAGGLRTPLKWLLNAGMAVPDKMLKSVYRVGAWPAAKPDLIISSGGKTLFASAALARRHDCPNLFMGTLRGLDAALFSAVLAPLPLPEEERIVLRVGGDHDVDLFLVQCLHRAEGQAGADVHVDLGPGAAELFQHREQPVITGVTFQRDMHAAGNAFLQRFELRLEGVDLGQDTFGQAQHPVPRCGQLQRLGPAHEQLHPRLVLQALDLVRQRRLCYMKDVRGLLEPACIMNRLNCAEMSELYVHPVVWLMIFVKFMSFSHKPEFATRDEIRGESHDHACCLF